MTKSDSLTKLKPGTLLTIQQITDHLGVRIHTVRYIIDDKLKLDPVEFVGNTRRFSIGHARVVKEIIDSRKQRKPRRAARSA